MLSDQYIHHQDKVLDILAASSSVLEDDVPSIRRVYHRVGRNHFEALTKLRAKTRGRDHTCLTDPEELQLYAIMKILDILNTMSPHYPLESLRKLVEALEIPLQKLHVSESQTCEMYRTHPGATLFYLKDIVVGARTVVEIILQTQKKKHVLYSTICKLKILFFSYLNSAPFRATPGLVRISDTQKRLVSSVLKSMSTP